MRVSMAGVRSFALLAVSIVAPAQVVTETKWVDNWEEKGKGRELLRKINGRWWTQDNREVTPPGPGGVFWEVDSRPGTVQFFHHRPFQLARAEYLHLWMSQRDVEAVLGQPNRIFGRDDHAFWLYYGANGTKVSVRFMGDAGLGEAKYEPVGSKSRSVASVEQDLGGQDLYKLLADRAWKKVQERDAQRQEEFRTSHAMRSSGRSQPSMVTMDPVPIPPATEPPPKRIVPAEAYATLAVGASREDVLSKLGEPGSRFTISDDEGARESLTYDLSTGETVTIRLLNGKVVKVR